MKPSVVITGADQGLGLALTKTFLDASCLVFAGQYENGGALPALAKKFPDRLRLIPLDITDQKTVDAAAKAVSEQIQSLEILINNAGIHLENSRKPLEEADFDLMTTTFQLNTMGPLRVTRAFLPLLRQGGLKRIVNISSEAGSVTDCNWRKSEFGYCMSKAALNMQSKILQNYLSPEGFKVLAIHPGWMRTEMGRPEADIEASESAEGITRLALKDWSVDEGMYFDYQGKPLPW